jgi:hypothetical protein
MPIISVPSWYSQEDCEFEASLSYIASMCLKENNDWRCSSVVKCIPSMNKSLGLIPSTTRGGRKEGRKKGRKKGRKEGKKERKKERRERGRKEGRKEG